MKSIPQRIQKIEESLASREQSPVNPMTDKDRQRFVDEILDQREKTKALKLKLGIKRGGLIEIVAIRGDFSPEFHPGVSRTPPGKEKSILRTTAARSDGLAGFYRLDGLRSCQPFAPQPQATQDKNQRLSALIFCNGYVQLVRPVC